ncbi:conserved hypothetical protein [Shewanella denitrificans OS217]|jgi:hypothetical protein|uniref:DUF3301 domain-containing protein n=1 Tax=Shewanella denitrificans (strain OS217 / ATCC BAA-1090 / DSM 15013) TaxID=318161 RepID=Q12NZ8_SHEDO|nr:DUF3301 domain-containing protein [Shewanella denitrificans]ABE54828.1 conserved hypothetical protein [Shewanella denitrificans OS217]
MMSDVILILALFVLAAFFWQLRQMAELSRVFAERACQKQSVQLLAIAMIHARPSFGGHTGVCWKAKFMFEFSTDGMDQHQGQLSMKGKQIQGIEWPVFPEPEWNDAPLSQGKFDGCGAQTSCNTGKCH